MMVQIAREKTVRITLSERLVKILRAMYRLSPEGPKFLRYEDIVVSAFENWPKDFQLAGYPRYPDASDIHKPLYDRLKKQGFVESGAKQFRLTSKGYQLARALEDPTAQATGTRRLDRETRAEVTRLLATDASRLIKLNQPERLLDSHFHTFFRTSPRLAGPEFLGRVEGVRFAVKEARECGAADADLLEKAMRALLNQFKDLVDEQSRSAIRR